MVVHHDKGLYYHCEDKWIPDHRCKPRLHILIIDEDMDSVSLSPLPDYPTPLDPNPTLIPHINHNAMEATPAPETFHLFGSIWHHQVMILVDSGADIVLGV